MASTKLECNVEFCLETLVPRSGTYGTQRRSRSAFLLSNQSMAKTKEQKQAILAGYKDNLSNAMGVIIVSPVGLTPNEASDFKMKLGELGSKFNVVKNTLFSLALKEAGLPELDTFEFGEHAVIFVEEDIAGTAKELKEFMKEVKEKLEIKGGILEEQELTVAQVEELSELPTKDQSIAMIAGLMTNAISATVNVLEDSVRSVATILDKAFPQESA